MCGICGIIDYKGGVANEATVRAMSDKMLHRGPDDSGMYINKNSIPHIGLGHRRLSIIDLSEFGRQPMTNENKDIWVVLNGEVYNYKTLRTELEARGHKFTSHTDTETVIHLYEEYGEDLLKYMRGMFAFALWDGKKKILIAARDRAGQKPLLYSKNENGFIFSSEFASLLSSKLISKEVNREAIHQYLTFGYIPPPWTIYKNVFKLPPAHMLILKDNKITVRPYWKLDYSKKVNISLEEASSETLRLLEESVRLRLHSDVPLGAFLSGGIDSSTIVALMSKASSKKVKTFSIGFEEKDYDELKYARQIAKRYGTEHNEFIVKPDAIKILPELVERYGEPYADSSCIPTYYVSRETRKYVTVALNGDGGDEFFAGYERYQAMLASEIYHKMPGVLKSMIKGSINALPDSANSKNTLRRIKKFFEGVDFPLDRRYLRWISVFSDSMKNSIYTENFKSKFTKKNPVEWFSPYINNPQVKDLLDKVLMTDVHTYLPNDLLVKVDITSMATSLEARSPFLDHKFMEFVASLPADYKMRNFTKKYILKEIAKELIPSSNIYRKKMGFGVPVGSWFRNELKEFLVGTLLSERALKRGYFKPEAIKDMVEKHISGKRDYMMPLWALLMLELWHKRFID